MLPSTMSVNMTKRHLLGFFSLTCILCLYMCEDMGSECAIISSLKQSLREGCASNFLIQFLRILLHYRLPLRIDASISGNGKIICSQDYCHSQLHLKVDMCFQVGFILCCKGGCECIMNDRSIRRFWFFITEDLIFRMPNHVILS